ncbi:unnamed protein product [Spodoptera littoralis]|uniref:Heparanase n=1 Tax=Spodoptera littoralis TaxID=7109 RepID=A0A9P0I5C4_SPOLI|nr:unnamed protein product [Spodoptera littoralis]CAH1641359.1 unnamed protein product [Spodoptera littoralis]
MAATIHLFLFLLLRYLSLCSSDTYSVKISTDEHVNVVDTRFLSFTIDPKYLFSSSDKYSSKECICMAASLTPSYLRIAGPSTAHMTFHNTTISINDVDFPDKDLLRSTFDVLAFDTDVPQKLGDHHQTRNLAVSHRQWRKFVQWAKSTGFDLVFALNNEERTAAGMWDPNTALNILTVAEKVKVGDIFWELGYECRNQSIDEYLNDLETLRAITETFPPGRTEQWKVVGGDVTKCLQAESKSDFKDYLTLSNDMMDALLLNGNSSSHELKRMSERDRLKLLRFFSRSQTPLWLTETNQKQHSDLERAADWLASLGYSAKNGFAVHFRELEEEEMYEPTLSFYMALLFKNLVGERVLNIEMDPEPAVLFAHCTSLRHKPVPGAVTLFGANMDNEPARFSLKLSKREEGGDIMQFILGNDHNGNIVVNGRPMYYEGNIKPIVKRVHPYKTLLINLPARSFGFWVLANTKIEACHNVIENKTLVEAETVDHEAHRVKRSVNDDFDDYAHIADLSYDFEDIDTYLPGNNALRNRISDMNRDLDKIQDVFKRNLGQDRFRRDIGDTRYGSKLRKYGFRHRTSKRYDQERYEPNPRKFIDDLLERARQRLNDLKELRSNIPRLNIYKKSNKYPKLSKVRSFKSLKEDSPVFGAKNRKPKTTKTFAEESDEFLKKINKKNKSDVSKRTPETLDKNTNKNEHKKTESEEGTNILESLARKRRSVDNDVEETSAENEIDLTGKNKAKLLKLLKKLDEEFEETSEEQMEGDPISTEGIILKTEVSDDSATIRVTDSNHGVIKTTMRSMLHMLEDFNKNLNKVWNAVNLLDDVQ